MTIVVATRDFNTAAILIKDYLKQPQRERSHAEEAIGIVRTILAGNESGNIQCLKCKEASETLEISMDALRNWEMNDLLATK